MTLTDNDVKIIADMIAIMSARGAFHAAELSTAGAIYDKLTSYLKSTQHDQQQDRG